MAIHPVIRAWFLDSDASASVEDGSEPDVFRHALDMFRHPWHLPREGFRSRTCSIHQTISRATLPQIRFVKLTETLELLFAATVVHHRLPFNVARL
jgi:hypothetical protein